MNWLITALVVLAALNYYGSGTRGVYETVPESTATGTARKAPKLIIPNSKDLEIFKAKIFPDPTKNIVTIQDIQPGKGAPAVCGQKVRIIYQSYDEDNVMFKDSAGAEKPLEYTIGMKEVIPALEEGVIGVKPDGVRNIFAPAHLAYDAKGFANDAVPKASRIRFEVKLLSATPEIPAPEDSSYRFFDAYKGLGTPLKCGDTARVHFVVWNTQGKKIYSSFNVGVPPIEVNIGKGEQFLGLEHAIIGMRPSTKRTVIVPPKFQKIWHQSDNTLPIKFPKNETVLVDIEATR